MQFRFVERLTTKRKIYVPKVERARLQVRLAMRMVFPGKPGSFKCEPPQVPNCLASWKGRQALQPNRNVHHALKYGTISFKLLTSRQTTI